MVKTKILIVEDNVIVAEDLKTKLMSFGYEVTATAYSGEKALESINAQRPDIALMDIRLGRGMNGIETASELKSEYDISVIYLTAHADDDTILQAKITEPYGYLIKPFDDTELKTTIEMAVYKQQSDRELNENRMWFQTTLNSIGDGVIAADMSGNITFMNPIAEMLTGWSQTDAGGKSFETVFNVINEITREPCENLVSKVIETGQKMELANHTSLILSDGKEVPIKVSSAPIQLYNTKMLGVILVFQDETESRKAEKKLKQQEIVLRQNQKLEAIGQLTAGLAHEINTPIQYVGDNTTFINEAFEDLIELAEKFKKILCAAKDGMMNEAFILDMENLLKKADIDYLIEEVPDALKSSFEGLEQVRKIIESMKYFSHSGGEKKVMTDIQPSIENAVTVAKNEWKNVANLTLDFEPELPMVFCNPNEMNQVFLNIIINAVHAISEKSGHSTSEMGTINIITKKSDNWVEIRISDSGTGMPDNIKERIFDPFFTTKEIGKGTGQGLSISRSLVVDRHKGKLEVQTSEDEGSVFIIKLPL